MHCNNCGNILPDDSVFCQFCGNKIEEVTVKEEPGAEIEVEEPSTIDSSVSSKQIEEQITQGENHIPTKSKNKFVSIVAIVLATILVITGATFFAVRSKKLDDKYQALQHEMLNVTFKYSYPEGSLGALYNNNVSTIKNIEEILDGFPKNYRNIEDINDQYKQIKKYAYIVENIDHENNYNNSEKLRNAYAELCEIDDQYDEWDLSAYLDKIPEQRFTQLISEKRWTNGDYYFQIYSSLENSTLNTNLPSNKNNNKEYTYWVSPMAPHTVTFHNANNEKDIVNAYEIIDIFYKNNKWQMKLYCHKDSNIYIFE